MEGDDAMTMEPPLVPESTNGQHDEGTTNDVPSSSMEVMNGSHVREFQSGMSNDDLWPEYCNPSYRMPPFIEVKVESDQGDYIFPVAIQKAETSSKKYLGGFRNKVTGNMFHHASSNTPVVKKELKDMSNLRTRETQTSELRTLSTQSYRECGTQMERIDVRVDNKNDRYKSSREYITAAEVNKLKLAKTIEIQRFWRGYVARCMAQALRRRNFELDDRDRKER